MIALCATPAARLDSGSIMRMLLTRQPFPRSRLYVMNDDGSDLRDLSERRPDVSITEAHWSPSGRALLAGGDGTYHVIDVDGSRVQRVALPLHRPFLVLGWHDVERLLVAAGNPPAHAWSWTTPLELLSATPDGKHLASLGSAEVLAGITLGARGRLIPQEAEPHHLQYSDRNGARARPLVMDGQPLRLSNGSVPVWSPDGVRVAFAAEDAAADAAPWLLCLEGDGSDLRRIHRVAFESPLRWSPDGRHLAFVGVESRGHALYCADVTTRDVRRLTSIAIGSAHGPRHAVFAWSAEGRSVVFEQAGDTTPSSLVQRIAREGGAPTVLAGTPLAFDAIDHIACGPSPI